MAPTEIQEKIIPFALEGKDIVGKSQTGTGKTAAFGIPICEKIVWEENLPQALILEPTRELADQVKRELFHIGRKKRLKVLSLLGGLPIAKQTLSLKQKAHIVVGTPGRIMDHIRRGNLNLSHIKYFVIDEADLMLDMGFVEEVEEIISYLPTTRCNMLFSATLDSALNQIITSHMQHPISIEIESETETVASIKQELYECESKDKYQILLTLLIKYIPTECMIFCGTREMVNTLYQKLTREHIRCGMLHGKLEQRERLQTIDAFREGHFQYLICTDVAARGIDFAKISHVINYDFPTGKETYVHRIGRTGRNGNSGMAISFVNPNEAKMIQTIEEYTLQKIETKICPPRSTLDEHGFWRIQKERPKRKVQKGEVLNEKITCLSIGGGKKSKMRPTDIVGTLCSIPDITPSDIGIIDIRESLTYVEILNNKGDFVYHDLQRKTIKGKLRKVQITKNMT
jgi:superfamily II DNA/RNA helicase